jgi:hypothetical protein
MTPRPKVASGPVVAQPALPLAASDHACTGTTYRATTTTTIKAGKFMLQPRNLFP